MYTMSRCRVWVYTIRSGLSITMLTTYKFVTDDIIFFEEKKTIFHVNRPIADMKSQIDI